MANDDSKELEEISLDVFFLDDKASEELMEEFLCNGEEFLSDLLDESHGRDFYAE